MNRLQPLPPPSHLSHSALTFLDHNFHTATVLTESPNFVAELQTQCSELDRALDDLTRRLGAGLAKYASFSSEIHSLFDGVKFKLSNLSDTCSSGIVQGLNQGSIWRFFILGFFLCVFECCEIVFLFLWLKMEEEEDEMGKVLEKNLRLWRRKLLGWRLFVFMQVSFFFFFLFLWLNCANHRTF